MDKDKLFSDMSENLNESNKLIKETDKLIKELNNEVLGTTANIIYNKFKDIISSDIGTVQPDVATSNAPEQTDVGFSYRSKADSSTGEVNEEIQHTEDEDNLFELN